MKFFALLALFAVSTQVTAQRSEFVDYLLDLQYIADPVHDAIAAFYVEARAKLSVDLTELNDEAVSEITQGLRAVIAIRDRTEAAVAENSTPENEVCINGAIENWPSDLQAVGAAIQACADAHVDPIYESTEDIHLYMQEHNKLAFDAQNLVLNAFTHVNPLSDADLITPTVSAQIDEITNEFETVVRVEVNRRLQEISNLRNSIPGEVHLCVDTAVLDFNTSALVVMGAVAVC